MSVRDRLLSSTVSFAHLHGIQQPVGASRAENGDDDDNKQREGESDEDYARRMENDGGDDEGDGDDEPNASRAEGEDGDPEDGEGDGEDKPADDKKNGKSKAAYRRGVTAERSRWASVLGNRAFAGNPALGARLLATTAMTAKAIVGCLRDSPAATAPHAGRAAGNPGIGPSGGAVPTGAAAIDQRWSAAFKRAGVIR